MKSRFLATSLALTLTAGFAVGSIARADDNIFPPAAAAKPFIDFDGRGFLVNGQRTFLASGSLHYARVPRALWRDRLLRMKRAGFNTVQTYAFWNFHEPKEGEWDFSGDKDLGAFLDLVKEMGMYATVRVGPYVCAEWDGGGYPVWLHFKTGMKVRQDDPQFEKYVGRWMDKVLPIVSKRQISHGGAVILVQLENEHTQGWGTSIPADPVYGNYFRFLRDKAMAAGIDVPWFFSGLHHGADPAGNGVWTSIGRTSPWYTTEFWPGWFDAYGTLDPERLDKFDRGTWKIIAHGGNGYNYYMLHGGSNFGFTNNNEDTASYDYGAAIGEAGDLRPIYYRFKRAAMFARSFQNVLENSWNTSDFFVGMATNPEIKVTARSSPAGSIFFLDNPGKTAAVTGVHQFGVDGGGKEPEVSLELAPGEIVPCLRNVQVAPGVLVSTIGRVLGVVRQDNITTLVMYGPPGSQGQVAVNMPKKDATFDNVEEGVNIRASGASNIPIRFPAAGQPGAAYHAGNLRILALADDLADRTWFVDAGGKTWIVIGPSYVGEASLKSGRLFVDAEAGWSAGSAAPETAVYGSGGYLWMKPFGPSPLMSGPVVPSLGPWESQSLSDVAQPEYRVRVWAAKVDVPESLGGDEDISAYGWYRAGFDVPASGDYVLHFSDAGDRIWAYIDGKPVGSSREKRRIGSAVKAAIPAGTLSTGHHTLAVFAVEYGRDKLFGYTGRLDLTDRKGLSGPVSLAFASASDAMPKGATVEGWEWKPASRLDEKTPGANRTAWLPARIGQDVFGRKTGDAWFRATLPPITDPKAVVSLHFESVDDDATVFFDGKMAAQHSGWDDPFSVPIPAGAKEVTVLVHNNDGVGGLGGPVTLESADISDASRITGWTMKGGPDAPEDLPKGSWKPYSDAAAPAGFPAFYRTTFDLGSYYGEVGPHPILRLSTPGMSRGFVYLNGHNLGRYPQNIPVDGVYMPECWLKQGRNELAIFDEEGKSPAGAKIVVEEAASRNVVTLAMESVSASDK